MSKRHPYQQMENDPLWRVLEKGVKTLVKNGDLEEKTARTHIVGFLAKQLRESGLDVANGSAKKTRVIRIERNEEVIVRGVA